MDLAKQIVARLESHMKLIGWNAIRLAKAADFDPSVVYRLFERKSGNLDTVIKLSQAMSVPVSELLKGEPVTTHRPHDLEDCISRVVNAARSGGKQAESGPLPAATGDVASEIAAILAPLDESQRRARLEMLRASVGNNPTLGASKKLK